MTEINLKELLKKIEEKNSWGKNELKNLILSVIAESSEKKIPEFKKETL